MSAINNSAEMAINEFALVATLLTVCKCTGMHSRPLKTTTAAAAVATASEQTAA